MTVLTKLRARVSPEAISKVTRIFNGTLDDIFNELFQNARRAGASHVAVTAEHLDDACLISVVDDGAGIADPVDLVPELVDFSRDRVAGGGVVGVVRGLDAQLTDTLEDAVDFVHCAFSGLNHRNAVVGVADGLRVTANLGSHLLANSEACRVVRGTVDAETAGQLLEHLAHFHGRSGEVALGVHRVCIVDD